MNYRVVAVTANALHGELRVLVPEERPAIVRQYMRINEGLCFQASGLRGRGTWQGAAVGLAVSFQGGIRKIGTHPPLLRPRPNSGYRLARCPRLRACASPVRDEPVHEFQGLVHLLVLGRHPISSM